MGKKMYICRKRGLNESEMNIDGLLKRDFGDDGALPVIEMFDSESIHAVYENVVNLLS